MKAMFVTIAFGLGTLFGANALAQAPAGAIAECKDGTYFTGTSHKGACRGHKGVKTWLDNAAAGSSTAAASDTGKKTKKAKKSKPAPAATAAPAAAPMPAPTPAPMPATKAAPAASTAPSGAMKHTPPMPASQIAAKPGGGPGLVWVNASSKVYHCMGDEWYGKTKEGSYMSEAAAKAAGNHPSHGKECGK